MLAVIFFFASAGASAAYLTVSEIFPLEVRAKAIAVFFAIAQCFGSLGSHLYGTFFHRTVTIHLADVCSMAEISLILSSKHKRFRDRQEGTLQVFYRGRHYCSVCCD